MRSGETTGRRARRARRGAAVLLIGALSSAGPGTGSPRGEEEPGPLLVRAHIRVPPPSYLAPGSALTGTVEAEAEEDGTRRQASPGETQGVIRIGERSVTVEDGRFSLEEMIAGQHLLTFLLPGGVGAELGRVMLVVPEAPGPAFSGAAGTEGRYATARAFQDGGTLLVTGSFSGAGDSPELLVDGETARLRWESPVACLFEAGAGETGTASGGPRGGPAALELRRDGRPVAIGTAHRIAVRFTGPEPPVVSERGEEIAFGAELSGLPPPGASDPKGEGLVNLVFRNENGRTATDMWSKSPRARREGGSPDGDLIVPVLPGMVGPDGTVSVAATAKGMSKGEVGITGRLLLGSRLTAASAPLSPPVP